MICVFVYRLWKSECEKLAHKGPFTVRNLTRRVLNGSHATHPSNEADCMRPTPFPTNYSGSVPYGLTKIQIINKKKSKKNFLDKM
jgi:hypothetical protein